MASQRLARQLIHLTALTSNGQAGVLVHHHIAPPWHTAHLVQGTWYIPGTYELGKLFKLKIVNTLIKNSSRDDTPSISTKNQPTANPLRVGQGQ